MLDVVVFDNVEASGKEEDADEEAETDEEVDDDEEAMLMIEMETEIVL